MSEEAEAFFVLPLREAVAYFACRIPDPRIQRWVISDDVDAHTSIEISTNFRLGFLPLHCKKGEEFLQQNSGFFAEETIRRYHERRKVTTLLKTSLEIILLLLAFMSH